MSIFCLHACEDLPQMASHVEYRANVSYRFFALAQTSFEQGSAPGAQKNVNFKLDVKSKETQNVNVKVDLGVPEAHQSQIQ